MGSRQHSFTHKAFVTYSTSVLPYFDVVGWTSERAPAYNEHTAAAKAWDATKPRITLDK